MRQVAIHMMDYVDAVTTNVLSPDALHLIIFTCPPHHEDHSMVMNVSLDTANNNAINISTLDFRIWQNFSRSWTQPHLQKLTNVPEVPVTQLYRNMINASEPIYSFTIKDDDEDSSLIWTILKHPGTYIGTICMIFVVCIGAYCFKRFWTRLATLRHWPYSPVSVNCHSGWWCRGSTHLQTWWQGWKTHKTPQESWPVHSIGGWKTGESL